MATYDSYKDSGVKWLGQIPSHWEVQRAKTIFIRHKRPIRPHDEIVTCFRDGQVTLRKNRRIEGFTNASKEFGYQGIRKGDLVIHEMDAFAGAIGVSDSDGKSTPVYTVCTTRDPENSVHYYSNIIRIMAKLGFIQSLSKGIRERSTAFSYDIFGVQLLPIPPHEEQQAIVAYLDKITGDIDRSIEAQQKLIDALNERKQIIITNAVTRGLNPDAPLRDSGIDWLGQIPQHWILTKVKYITDNLDKLRRPITADQRSRNNPKYDYYGASGAIDKIDYYCVDDRVLLIGEDGANLKMRNLPLIYKANGKFWVNNHAHILKEKAGFDYDYLAFLLEAGDYTNYITGSAQPKLTKANLGAFRVAVPPYEEQILIVNHVKNLINPLNISLSNCERMIALLQERKQIIINEVVTGKKKVI